MVGNPDQIIEDQLYWCCRDNKSLSSCANDVVRTLNLYTLGNFACSITNKWPAYAWKSYEGIDSRCIYGLFGVYYSMRLLLTRYESIERLAGNVRMYPLYELR